jgi:MOSC domain-containing protein YiiM
MAAKLMVQSGFTGYYCEVLQPGDLAAGELLELIPGARTLTVLDRHRLDTDAPQRALPF